jgi:cellulose synthase/poly-beta-1,6-N-acetylglucosamine synthase-like glycosyltransferase
LSQRIYGFLGALYLERRNFDCAATTHIDGGMPCLSGRTCAYRTSILQDVNFTDGFTNEKWWFGQYQLNADDDNFITRWMVNHGHEITMQYHPECEVKTTLEDNPKFLKQCLRWARSNWRSNLTSIFAERVIWTRQPWSTYAVQITTLSPPAIAGDAALIYLLWLGTAEWSHDQAATAMYSLIAWMTFSKFIKLITHFVRYPVDLFLWPISILFGWFHGLIKYYALATLSEVSHLIQHFCRVMLRFAQTTWGSRAGADADDKDRMIKQTKPLDYFAAMEEKSGLSEKTPFHDNMSAYATHDLKRIQAVAA